MKKILYFILFFIYFLYANELQNAINTAPIGSVIKLSDGIYQGNIYINKPLTIIGNSKNVIIKGNNKNSVITITSSNVVLKNLTIIDSGSRLETLDSGVKISKSNNINIINCKIKNTLYGIIIDIAKNCTISSNYISSKNCLQV
jgi:nitrous oxidase accessory protein